MKPSQRSVFVELNGPDQDHARPLSIAGIPRRQTRGWMSFDTQLGPENFRNGPFITPVYSRSLAAME
jgi:hypothetical protein